MKKLLSGLSFVCLLTLLFFSCDNNNKRITRPGSTVPFDGTIVTDVSYGSNVDYMGVTQDLKLDVYIPQKQQASQKFPLVVYIHGGGFIVGDKDISADFCKLVSNNGFVTATINYRLGWNREEDNTDPCQGDSTQLKYAIYRAIQDAKASLRFLSANADDYSIDTNWIFVSGSSAGGVTSLFSTYMTQDSVNYYLPGAEDSLGTLDNSSNTLKNTYTIKGIGNFWGAMVSPYFITAENAVPTIFTHGRLDNVVPFDIEHVYHCDNFPLVFGSLPLYERTKSFGVPCVMHEDPTGEHGVFDNEFNANNMSCFFNSIIDNDPITGYYTGHVSNCP